MADNSFSIPRHWWGKIIGGALGLFRGGVSGALIGLILGHLFDRFVAGIISVSSTKTAFFNSLFSVLGHLGKADGRVTQTEILMVEQLMQRMQIGGEERKRAIRLFNQGKRPEFDLYDAMRPFVQFSKMRPDLRRMFMEILVEAAWTSGQVTPAENDILLAVARLLRIPPALFNAMMQARGTAGAQYAGSTGGARGGAPGRTVHRLEQDYAQLGLQQTASDAEVKKAYRKLVSQYHPDKLVSHGLPDEMAEIAKKRIREINTAYDRIKQARGFK
jgi:DnaJ like chaperone protein